jgi:hypothetical protein
VSGPAPARARETARLLYHVARNLRLAMRDAMFGAQYAEMARLRRIGRVTVGPGTYGWPRIWTDPNSQECLHVGSYSSLGGTYILGGKHAIDRLTTYPLRINMRLPGAGSDGFPTPTGDTIVGSDVWTCEGSLILSGVRIGDGAIVGAGAVVTRDVPAYAVVAGNPARLIRYRFEEDVRAALLELRWWDWPQERIRQAVELLCGRDPHALIAWARERGGVGDDPDQTARAVADGRRWA